MRVLLTNQNAGSSAPSGSLSDQLSKAGIEVDRIEIAGDDPPTALSSDDELIVAGGDGTIRSQIDRCIESGCTLGVLPSGTGNDFARGLDIPLTMEEAYRVLIEGPQLHVDVGLVNDEYFLNAAHIGFATQISDKVDDAKKSGWGRFAYVKTVLDQLKRLRGFRATISCATETVSGRWLQITVANGRSFGGGQQVNVADPRDGQLDLIAIRPRPIWQLVWIWVRARIHQDPAHDPALWRCRAAEIRITAHRAYKVSADGERITALPATFRVKPQAIRVRAGQTVERHDEPPA